MNISQLKGYIFELEVLYLVLQSGYKVINNSDVLYDGIRGINTRKLEFQGRGTWHQIDIPCDSLINPSFIYPIRLFGEVKYHNKKIDKSYIREYIGVKDDITQNYCVAQNANIKYEERQKRRTEVFAYFSALGFDSEAEKLAYAHGIKTISYDDNKELRIIKQKTDDLAHLLKKYKIGVINKFLDYCFKVIIGEQNLDKEIALYLLELDNNIYNCFNLIREELLSIHTAFFATANSGFTIHIVSKNRFPEELFSEKDEALVSIHKDEMGWYLSFTNYYDTNKEKNKFYFSMPQEVIEISENINGNQIFPDKELYFSQLSFSKMINGKNRSLKMIFNRDWFGAMRLRNS